MRSGAFALRELARQIREGDSPPVDLYLIRRIHRMWFETTFPDRAGIERTTIVLNRKGTAYPPAHIVEGVQRACDDWRWRQENVEPASDEAAVAHAIAEANELIVRVYDIHPFIDGNTRTAWHLRNYALMLSDLPPLDTLGDWTEALGRGGRPSPVTTSG